MAEQDRRITRGKTPPVFNRVSARETVEFLYNVCVVNCHSTAYLPDKILYSMTKWNDQFQHVCNQFSVNADPRHGFCLLVETLVTWYLLSVRMVHLPGSLLHLLLLDNMDTGDVSRCRYSDAYAVSQSASTLYPMILAHVKSTV